MDNFSDEELVMIALLLDEDDTLIRRQPRNICIHGKNVLLKANLPPLWMTNPNFTDSFKFQCIVLKNY